MKILVRKKEQMNHQDDLIIIARKDSLLDDYDFTQAELDYIKQRLEDESEQVSVNKYGKWRFIQFIDEEKNGRKLEEYKIKEKLRKAAHKMHTHIKMLKLERVSVVDLTGHDERLLAFAEGLALSNYQFIKYFKDKEKKKNKLSEIALYSDRLSDDDASRLEIVIDAVYKARDLVNEPLSYLTAEQLSQEIREMGRDASFKVEVFSKAKIERLGMGGLLAVNKGSIDPPTFNILEWKPKDKVNTQPVVLVGKGVVFDTGGLSLKPTPDSMDQMKCDMAGAAAVAAAVYAVAKAKLPIHVIGLIPATDNRPDGNAYAPGDVIKMHNGLTVEVLNTDAEGRMILADALSYAQQYEPELVIDAATLTGAAAVAIGQYGIVGMHTEDATRPFDKLKKSGEETYERIAEFPFWDEYGEMMKSDIADLKNVGGRIGGAITAGKFLENFTNYPYIHLDIAGPAFLTKPESYNNKGGTGSAVRLLFDFLKNKSFE